MNGKKYLIRILVLAFAAGLVIRAGVKYAEAAKPGAAPVSQAALVSYISEGALWLNKEDGSGAEIVVRAPEGGAVSNQLWSADGARIFYNIGYRIFAYGVSEKKSIELGQLAVPEGAMIDRVEVANDNSTLLFHTLDPNDVLGSVPHIFAFGGSPVKTRELSVDEYHLLCPAQSPVIRNPGDMSVSPDGKSILFAEIVGTDMQLFVADMETGARHQLTSLGSMEGFETEATTDGGRRILEATWLPDSRHVVFVPAQSCSEFGLCSGMMYLADLQGGDTVRLSGQLSAGISQEWNLKRKLLVYDDGGQVVVSDLAGKVTPIGTGNQPKWQPLDLTQMH